MPCPYCAQPGDCEDCLPCLMWPDTLDDLEPPPPRPPQGLTSSLPTGELTRARQLLDVGRRAGLVLRRHRRSHALTQRQLAAQLGWSAAMVSRAESDAGRLLLLKVEEALRHTGYRLAIVPEGRSSGEALGEDPDEVWGVIDLVARDGRGRRPPPFAQVTWENPQDRLQYGSRDRLLPQWRWSRPVA